LSKAIPLPWRRCLTPAKHQHRAKKTTRPVKDWSFFMVGGEGIEPSRAKLTGF
jgi:hypothetical protein